MSPNWIAAIGIVLWEPDFDFDFDFLAGTMAVDEFMVDTVVRGRISYIYPILNH